MFHFLVICPIAPLIFISPPLTFMCSVAHGGLAALSALLLPAAQHCEVRDNVEPYYYYCVMFNMDLACSASSRRHSPLSSSPTLLQMGGQNSISGSRVHAYMHARTGAMMRAIRTSSSPSTLAILSCLAHLPVRSASLLPSLKHILSVGPTNVSGDVGWNRAFFMLQLFSETRIHAPAGND